MPNCVRDTAGDPLEIGKDPVALLAVQPDERIGEKVIVVHDPPPIGVAASNKKRDAFNQRSDWRNGQLPCARSLLDDALAR